MIDSLTLKNYYALSCKWERDLIKHYDQAHNITNYEARILVHLWRNKGSYANRIIRLLNIKRSTAFAILERLQQQKVIFSHNSPISGNRIYKIADSPVSKAFLSAAFLLCICENLKQGANENEIFD